MPGKKLPITTTQQHKYFRFLNVSLRLELLNDKHESSSQTLIHGIHVSEP